MKEIWLESALEDIEKAEKKLEIGDYKRVCILSRISATKSIFSVLQEFEELQYVDDIGFLYSELIEHVPNIDFYEEVKFLKRFVLYDDIITPYVIEKWQGLPTKEEAERALSIAKKFYEKFKSM